ncbi:MAG: prepilin-type N-terminal cleavage/methylation domain-containing protein [Patescibacteria group bacterium]
MEQLRSHRHAIQRRNGFTLIETLIAVAIMTVVAFSVYRALAVLLEILETSEVRVAAAALANEKLEYIRNMTYPDIGIVGGAPSGYVEPIDLKKRRGIDFTISTIIRNIDDPFDGVIGGNPNDLSPADYKLIEITVQCSSPCSDPQPFVFTGRAAPRTLENASTNGSLFVQVIDASGQPVSGATVQVVNTAVTPQVNINDITDVNGFLKIIDVPPSVQMYHVAVTKNGYSSDQTYAITPQNPNPIKPDATVALQTVTQVTLSTDRVSTLNFSSVNEACTPIPNIDFSLAGAKLIGTAPNVLKYNQNFATDGSGLRTVSGLEWDNYTLTVPVGAYALRGAIPLSPIAVSPNSTQSVKIVATPQVPQSLLVTVRDSASLLPLSNASVRLTGASYDTTLVTGRGFLRQTDWSGGAGQDIYQNQTKYFDQDGNIDTANPAGDLKLLETATSTYANSGVLTSSTFDTGSPSTFYAFTFNPGAQPPQTGQDSVKFQFATATTTSPTTWNYLGPDGTSGTYYTVSVTDINAVHTGDQYFRYRVFLGTPNQNYSPTLSDIAVTFASSCVPPGQVLFTGLPNDTYTIEIQRTSYQTLNDITTVNQAWQEFPASLFVQ